MDKKWLLPFLVIILISVILGVATWYVQTQYHKDNSQSLQATPGEGYLRCGGNIRGAKQCPDGYRCVSQSNLPVGDVGGVCVPN